MRLDSIGARILMLDFRIVVVILSKTVALLIKVGNYIIYMLSQELMMVLNFLPLEFHQDNFNKFNKFISTKHDTGYIFYIEISIGVA